MGRTRTAEARRERSYGAAVLFGASLLIALAAFAPLLLRNHYSTDSYHLIGDQHTLWYLQCGRYTFWAFACFFEKIGVNLVLAQRWFIAFCLLCLAGCTAALVLFIERLSGLRGTAKGAFLVLPIALIWCNAFTEDWMLFPEAAGNIALAALGLTASVILFFGDRTLLSLLLSAALLLATLGAYQSMVGSYIAITVIVGCLKYRGDVRGILISAIKGIVIGGVCAALNIVILKALISSGLFGDSGRGSTFELQAIISNLVSVIQYQVAFWKNADGLVPFPVMQLLEASILVLFVEAFRHSRKSGLAYLLAFVISLGAAYAPHYVEAAILLSPRSNIAVWAAIGCILAVLWCDAYDEREAGRGASIVFERDGGCHRMDMRVSAYLLAAFGLASLAFMWDLAYDVYASNVQDREYAKSVATAIRNYEEENSVSVVSMGIVSDASVEVSYPETRYKSHELGRRIMNVAYSRVEMINYLSGMNLQQVEVSQDKASELFGDADWDHEDLSRQLKIEDGTAYLAVY